MPVDVNAFDVVTRCEQEVSPRWVLAYSAALDLTTPEYLDDARPGGVVVPPTFCVCLEWAATQQTRTRLLGLTEQERARGVHAWQRSEFLAPMRTGSTVEVSARVVHLRQTSAGAYVVSRYDVTDRAGGTLLVRTWSGSMFRGVALSGPGRGEAPEDPGRELAGAVQAWSVPLGAGLPHIYSECARIWNPIHTERTVAHAAGLDDIIVHGSATWSIAARELAPRFGGLRALRSLSGRFRKPVKPGESMTIRMAQPSGGEVPFEVLNEGREVAIAGGVARFGS